MQHRCQMPRNTAVRHLGILPLLTIEASLNGKILIAVKNEVHHAALPRRCPKGTKTTSPLGGVREGCVMGLKPNGRNRLCRLLCKKSRRSRSSVHESPAAVPQRHKRNITNQALTEFFSFSVLHSLYSQVRDVFAQISENLFVKKSLDGRHIHYITYRIQYPKYEGHL